MPPDHQDLPQLVLIFHVLTNINSVFGDPTNLLPIQDALIADGDLLEEEECWIV